MSHCPLCHAAGDHEAKCPIVTGVPAPLPPFPAELQHRSGPPLLAEPLGFQVRVPNGYTYPGLHPTYAAGLEALAYVRDVAPDAMLVAIVPVPEPTRSPDGTT